MVNEFCYEMLSLFIRCFPYLLGLQKLDFSSLLATSVKANHRSKLQGSEEYFHTIYPTPLRVHIQVSSSLMYTDHYHWQSKT